MMSLRAKRSNLLKEAKIFSLPVFKDARGALCPIEFKELPFKPKRSYFIFDTKTMRGGHAHKKEQEIFVCIKGSLTARIHNGKKWKDVRMYKPGQAIYTPAYVWHEFEDFTPGSILAAFSSNSYEGNKNYITDFKEFLSFRPSRSSAKQLMPRHGGATLWHKKF